MRLAKLNSQKLPTNVEDAAAYWLARCRLGRLTARERAAFNTWRADPACAAAYEAAEATLDDLGVVAADPRMLQMREAALAHGSQPASAWHHWRYAATAAVALIALLTLKEQFDHSPPEATVASAPMVRVEATAPLAGTKRYTTRVGERSTIALEDGSVISLNTASVVDVAYSHERRDVRLLQGQALFQVAKNPQRPFVVAAGDRRVIALGTAFDVRLESGTVKVVLVEGRVTVEPMKLEGLERLVPALVRMELAPGEQLTATENRPVSVAVADVERDTSWRRGEIILRDDLLTDAVAEMNRYTQTQILIDDPRINRLRVSGVFGVSRPENFIAALLAYYPIKAQRQSPGVTVLAWRDDAPMKTNTAAAPDANSQVGSGK